MSIFVSEKESDRECLAYFHMAISLIWLQFSDNFRVANAREIKRERESDEVVIAIAIDLVIELSFRLYLFHFITLMGFEPICKSSSLYEILYACMRVCVCV